MLRRLALTLTFAVSAFAGERPRVVVVKSSPLSAYAQVVAGFSAEVKAQVDEVTLESGSDAAVEALKKVSQSKPALVLAIGPAAAVAARRQLSDVPMLFTMVPCSRISSIALS